MTATLAFLRDLPLYQEEQPFEIYGYPDLPRSASSNCQFESRSQIPARDARGSTQDFELNECGFVFLTRPSQCPLKADQFENMNEGCQNVLQYLDETRTIVKEYFLASRVICFDWRVRDKHHNTKSSA